MCVKMEERELRENVCERKGGEKCERRDARVERPCKKEEETDGEYKRLPFTLLPTPQQAPRATNIPALRDCVCSA